MTKSNLAIFAIAGIALMMGMAVLPADAGKPVSNTIEFEITIPLNDVCNVKLVSGEIKGKLTETTYDNGKTKFNETVKGNFYDLDTGDLLGKFSQVTAEHEVNDKSENYKSTFSLKYNCMNGEKNEKTKEITIIHGDKITIKQ